ncbi:MAG: D-alanyl-D-alanine carboxypeptidase family protein [Oscillospiraceae bacterium]|nr:D-alanyl-D-alanine carboxypeptidase family protein [Oscillospiraceae bacterium]
MNKRNMAVILGLLAAVCILAFLAALAKLEPDASKAPQTGWVTEGQLRYYYHSDGSPAAGWTELDGKRHFFRDDGSLVTGWLSRNGRQLYLDEEGTPVTGPREIDGSLYLFNEEGYLADGIFLLDGVRYRADTEGRPLPGWAEADSMRCCFDETGRALTGWQTIDGLDYYFYSDGSPAAGITEIDGKLYHFSSNGQYIPLVNPWNYVPGDYTVELAPIAENHQVASIALADFEEMIRACEDAGLDPAVCSSYRTQEYQELLYSRKVAFYTARGYAEEEAKTLAGRSVAVPGTSEHQLGLALDIIDNGNWNLNESQAHTATQKWLMEHSWEYGWILRYPDGKSDITGIIFEPWHYRYVGREVAAEIHELDVCLEEYLQMLTVG